MATECNTTSLSFQDLGRRTVSGDFAAGRVSSDGGLMLVRELEDRRGLMRRFAQCFADFRDQQRVEHSVLGLVSQRVLGLVAGYEDLNDHDRLRDDPVMAVCCGTDDLEGAGRRRASDRGHALAGKSTLNRLEVVPTTAEAKDRYHLIRHDPAAIDALLVQVALESVTEPPSEIILDVDATDDPLHGNQEGRFFHGYYRHYCYLPLYIFWGSHVLCARLRPADRDGATGCVDEVARIVSAIRARWPQVRIIVRGDSGFCRDALMTWCETEQVDYVLGLAKNPRLKEAMADELWAVKVEQEKLGGRPRRFVDFRYRTRDSWSAERRVVGKAEQLPRKSNPRFVVTSLSVDEMAAAELYEELYCARGDMENRIKEQQLCLFADRTSTHTMVGNQLRLYFSTMAYVVLNELRRLGLSGTEMQQAQCDTIRTRVLKIGALVKRSVRRLVVSLCSAYPWQPLVARILANLRSMPPLPG